MKSNSMSYATAAAASLAVLIAFVFSGRSHLPAAFGQTGPVTGQICSVAVGFGCFDCKGTESPSGTGCTNPVPPPGGSWGLCISQMYANGCLTQQFQNCGDMKDCTTGVIVTGQCSTFPWCI
jgi:hypothetical protein